MDCNFTIIKTCELKDSAFRSRILDFGDFDISDYTFSVVYKTGFDQIISEQELTAIGNILTVPLESIEGTSNRAKAEVWMLRDGGFKDKVIVFDVVISATGCPSDASITEGVSVTFGGMKVPVEVNQGIVNISREVAFSTLSPEEKVELKGEKGESFVYEDFTPEQLATLKGPQGDPLTFSDLTTQQVNELKQPALDAAVIATTAAQNADTAAGLATDATVEAVNATGQAIAATAQAENAAENADEAAVEALAAKDAANAAAANNVMRYNDVADTLAPDVIRRVDEGTKIEQEYKQTPTNIDGIAMTDAMVDGFAYLKRGAQYFMNSDFAIKREVYVDSYGLPGDGVFHKISELFPDVTLAEVQAFNPIATLDNSADWYMLMKLNKDLPVNSTLYLTGKYVIDLEITWRRSSITWKGVPYKYSSKYQSDKVPSITQIGAGEHCIAIRDGDGLTNHYAAGTQILNVYFEDFNIIGTKTVAVRSGHGVLIDITLGDFVLSHFKNVRVTNHGMCGYKHIMGHINEVYWKDCQTYGNFDTGMWLDGKPSSQTNLLGFEYCGFGSNGTVIRNGELHDYDHTIDGIDYTKGGISIGNMSSTDFNSINTQSNCGFGFMAREGAALAGVHVTAGYSEMNPLGDWVILADLNSNFTLNAGSLFEIAIFPNIITGSNYFSVFKSLEHLRKFVPVFGLKYLREQNLLPWSENIITDAKNRIPYVGEAATRTVTNSTDQWGSKITTISKEPNGLTWINWLIYDEGTRVPLTLDEGDVISFSFDIRFDSIHPDDQANFASSQFGVRRYKFVSLSFMSPEDKPTFDGEWKRVHMSYEHDGTYFEDAWPIPFIYMGGSQPLTFSVRNPEFKIKTRRVFFAENSPNASVTLKGVVNQAAAVGNVAAGDATDLATAITLVNELKSKLNAKLAADRTAGQQAT